ncbi:MAG: hypothetical protein ABSH26_12340 [Opitutaceae bacterium]
MSAVAGFPITPAPGAIWGWLLEPDVDSTTRPFPMRVFGRSTSSM